MKKLLATLTALSVWGLGFMALAADKPEPGAVASIQEKPAVAKPVPAEANPEIAKLEEMIAKKKDFATRAKFTEEGEEQYKKELADMENRLAQLRKEPQIVICVFPPDPGINPKPFPVHWGKPPAAQTKDLRPLPGGFGQGSSTLARWIEENLEADKQKEKPKPKPEPVEKAPTFEEWVKGGMKIPEDMVFIGGSPRFDESTGKNRSDEEVYKLIFGKPSKPEVKPGEKPGEKPGGLLGKEEQAKPPVPFRPKKPARPELPEALQEKMDDYKGLQDLLRRELKASLDQLGDDATKEDVRKAAETFRENHAKFIDQAKEMAEDIHKEMEANRPDHVKIDRPEPPAEVKEKADAVRGFHQQLGEARHDLHKALKDASEEDRAAMITAFKEAQKEHHKELKEAKKALREAIRDNAQTGDRRSDD